MVDEIKEELGYEVSKDDLVFIGRSKIKWEYLFVAPGSVGISGARMYMFYTEITPEQKVFTLIYFKIEISRWWTKRGRRADFWIPSECW